MSHEHRFSYMLPKSSGACVLDFEFDSAPHAVHAITGETEVGGRSVLDRIFAALACDPRDLDENDGSVFIPAACPRFTQFLPLGFGGAGPREDRRQLLDMLQGLEARQRDKPGLFLGVMMILNSDPVFSDVIVKDGVDALDDMGSGHRAALLAVLSMIENARLDTLVLIDRPEASMPPSLIPVFMQALCFITGYVGNASSAIVATNSPHVLQDVRKDCVWSLRRFGRVFAAARPAAETYGENAGAICRDVLGHDLMKTCWYNAIVLAAAGGGGYDDVVARLGGEIGAEGRAMIMAAVAQEAVKCPERP